MSDEFQHLFQAAAKLKSHQLKSDRPKFERWPKYRQNSCFPKEDVLALREKPHAERLAGLNAIKSEGNALFKRGDFYGALARYEAALSVVTYVVNSEPDWRNKSIKDEDLTEFDYDGSDDASGRDCGESRESGSGGGGSGTGSEDGEDQDAAAAARRAEVSDCKLTCYLNLAAAYLKLQDWSSVIAASTDAIVLAPDNAKAHFRRAMARLTPLSSGATEVEQGFKDLKCAALLDPSNKTIARTLRRVTAEQKEQRKRDRKNYSGFLHRTKPLYKEKVVEQRHQPHDDHVPPASAAEEPDLSTMDGGSANIDGSGGGGGSSNSSSSSSKSTPGNGRFGAPEAMERQFREIEMMIKELEADGDYAKVGWCGWLAWSVSVGCLCVCALPP